MKKYPSIEQFRNVIRKVKESHDYQGKDEEGNSIYSHKEYYPILKFKGTVKLHGTNASVVRYIDGRTEFQSRERVLSLEQDNSGFMNYMTTLDLEFLFERFGHNDFVAIYGEWCGGNIQKGVAINGIPKMFVIFGIMVDDKWIDLPHDLHKNSELIFNVEQFKTYEVDIDFNNPQLIQNKLIDMTMGVEELCPVGEFFKKEGIGEGIVFTCTTNQDLKFKSKGEKHSASKVKVLNSIDVESMEGINSFVEMVVSENRLLQGLSVMKENCIPIESKNTGEFLRWIVKDILKEESDTISENNLDDKKLKNAIVTKSRIWFLNQN